MDNRAIGVFDSGLGGLTAVKQLMRELPHEDIIYFGDTGRVPYGTRSVDTIIKYVEGDIRFLKTFDIKIIVVACGTASAVALPVIGSSIGLPAVGVLDAASKAAVKVTKNKKIGIIGTPSTIASKAYGTKIRSLMADVGIYSAACPLFVPLVENGHTSSEVVRLVAQEYLGDLKDSGIDTLILGCTHYPLLKGVISGIMGNDVALIDVGEQTAKRVGEFLCENGLMSERTGKGSCRYFVSDTTENFEKLGSLFLQQRIEGLVNKVDIEKY